MLQGSSGRIWPPRSPDSPIAIVLTLWKERVLDDCQGMATSRIPPFSDRIFLETGFEAQGME